MRLSRSQRRTGTRRPQRGSVGRVRLYNVTDDAVVDGPQSGCAGWAEGRDPAAARPPRRRGAADPAWRVALDDEAFVVDARVGVRSVVQHGVDHAHQLVGGGKDPSRYPTLCGRNDVRRVQRRDATLHLPVQVHARRASWSVSLTWARPPRREKFLKRHIPGLAGIHPGIRRSADPTTDRGQSYMALSKPRTTEPGSRDDHADTGRHLAPGATHLPGAVPVTAEIARHPQKKLGAAPERSRSASTLWTGWRWGQSRANPSRRDSRPVRRGRTKVVCGIDPGKSRNIPLQPS